MIESEYETCQSDVTSTTDDEDDVRSKRTRRRWKSLSRTDSGVSLNTNKEEFQGKEQRSTYSRNNNCKENVNHSIISEIFDGKIASEIECLTCNRRSKTIETFQDLSLPIPSKEQIYKFHSLQSANEEFNSSNNNHQDSSFEQNNNQSWTSWFYSILKKFVRSS